MATRQDIIAAIARRVGSDTQGLRPEDFLLPGLRLYDRAKPRTRTVSVTGDGTSVYALATVATDWVPGASEVEQIEYPAGEDPPVFLEDDEYLVRDLADSGTGNATRAQSLVFLGATPAATETFLLQFNAPHKVENGYSTVPVSDEPALADLCAAAMLEEVAVRLEDSGPVEGLAADLAPAFDSKASGKRTSARNLYRRAWIALGLPPEGPSEGNGGAGGGRVIDHDMAYHQHAVLDGTPRGVGLIFGRKRR